MDNGIILIAVLLIVLIYFIAQLPIKSVNKEEVVYVNRQYPLWNGYARPLRRYPRFGGPFYRGYF
jgi:hypothetical protein